MLHSLITIVTLLATGVHGIIGCCWHHEHATPHAIGEEAPADSQQAIASEHACGCGHAEHAKPSDRDRHLSQTLVAAADGDSLPCEDPCHHDSHHCNEGQCQYLVNAKVELPSVIGKSMVLGILPWGTGLNWLSVDRTGFPSLSCSALNAGNLCVRDLTQIALI